MQAYSFPISAKAKSLLFSHFNKRSYPTHIKHLWKTCTFFNILFYHIHFFRNVINLKYENRRKHAKVMKKIIFLPKRNLFSERRDNDILDITHLKNQILCYRISKNAISYFYKKNWFGIEFDNAGHVQAPYVWSLSKDRVTN